MVFSKSYTVNKLFFLSKWCTMWPLKIFKITIPDIDNTWLRSHSVMTSGFRSEPHPFSTIDIHYWGTKPPSPKPPFPSGPTHTHTRTYKEGFFWVYPHKFQQWDWDTYTIVFFLTVFFGLSLIIFKKGTRE